MENRVRVYDPDGVRTREERESLVKKFSPAEGKHGRDNCCRRIVPDP